MTGDGCGLTHNPVAMAWTLQSILGAAGGGGSQESEAGGSEMLPMRLSNQTSGRPRPISPGWGADHTERYSLSRDQGAGLGVAEH